MWQRPMVWIVILAVAAILAPVPGFADDLDDLRRAGAVGERYDGYAVVRAEDASSAVRQTVADVNRKRREIYDQRAADEGVPADQVGRVYAKKIWENAPPGTWFERESGDWVQKP